MFCQNKENLGFFSTFLGEDNCDSLNLEAIPVTVLIRMQKLTNGKFLGTLSHTQQSRVKTDSRSGFLLIDSWFYENGSLHNGDSTGRFWFAYVNGNSEPRKFFLNLEDFYRMENGSRESDDC